SGEFLRLQLLIDKGYHPLAYRMMCLQAHYRSELEFSWEGLGAALTRLKRMLMAIEKIKLSKSDTLIEKEKLDIGIKRALMKFEDSISNDLNTPAILDFLGAILYEKTVLFDVADLPRDLTIKVVEGVDSVLGLDLLNLTREDMRLRPKTASITETEIESMLEARKAARAEKDFARSDALRDELAAKGVEVMDGDPLGWDWKLG
ncbi:MAG TPA: cysteine--tRNA ligase, partial [Novosphingobium sp.]|nr:cysteine--tRNA ligase [Novosphingobium sp.]